MLQGKPTNVWFLETLKNSRGLLLRLRTTYMKSSTVIIVAMIMPAMAAPITAG